MDRTLRRALGEILSRQLGEPIEVESAVAVGGGSINQAFRVSCSDRSQRFVKTSPEASLLVFQREADGLQALGAPGILRVPESSLAATANGQAFLILDWIETGSPANDFQATFGRQLARLHRATAESDESKGRFGFGHDNWIGATPQPNGWKDDWVDFWREHRLGFQLDLARKNGLSDPELDRLGENLLNNLERWIDLPEEPPCLLHGDLWGGNYLVDQEGDPVLIDPATYYGHREAELAMTRLFGGFQQAFYTAYEDEWPLPTGSETRLKLYELYHLLNHLNLFGRGYRGSCLGILRGVT